MELIECVDHRIFTRIDVDESFKCRTEYRILKYEHVKKYALMEWRIKTTENWLYIQRLVTLDTLYLNPFPTAIFFSFEPSKIEKNTKRSKQTAEYCQGLYIGGGGGGAEKLELCSKNLDSTPLQNKKK